MFREGTHVSADIRGFWKKDPAIHLDRDGTSFAINDLDVSCLIFVVFEIEIHQSGSKLKYLADHSLVKTDC